MVSRYVKWLIAGIIAAILNPIVGLVVGAVLYSEPGVRRAGIIILILSVIVLIVAIAVAGITGPELITFAAS